MQQNGRYSPTAAHVSALSSVVPTLGADIPTLERAKPADALAARLRRASSPGSDFVADGDANASRPRPMRWRLRHALDGLPSRQSSEQVRPRLRVGAAPSERTLL
jgi:hypothetical protein